MFQVPIQKPMESLQFMLGTYESSKKPLEKKYCKFNKGASMRSGVCDVTWPRSSVVPWRIVFCCGLTSRWKSCLDSRQSQLANWVFVDFTHLLGLPCRVDFHLTFWDPNLHSKGCCCSCQHSSRCGETGGSDATRRFETGLTALLQRPGRLGVGSYNYPSSEHGWLENHLSFHRRLRYIFIPGTFSSQLCYSTRATKCQRCHDWSVHLSYQI